MNAAHVSRSISALLIPCLLYFCASCYTYQTHSNIEEIRRAEGIVVLTKDGLSYRLRYWNAGPGGALYGIGNVYQSELDAEKDQGGDRFVGTIPAEKISP